MIQDVWIVARQECRSIRLSYLPNYGAMLTIALVVALFGLVVPIGLTRGWLNATGFLFLWFWLPWLFVAGPISDSFAGEGERHTLDALFATRLPSFAILTGKTVAVALYAGILGCLALIVSAVVYSATAEIGRLPTMPTPYLQAAAVTTPLAAALAAAAGALISLSALSARQAHQLTMVVVPALMLTLLVLSRLVQVFAPISFGAVSGFIASAVRAPYWLPLSVMVLTLLSVAALLLASKRLQRRRVIPA